MTHTPPPVGVFQSMSYSDWLNTCVLSDSTGEMIVVLLPDTSLNPANLKRTSDRRFVRDVAAWRGVHAPRPPSAPRLPLCLSRAASTQGRVGTVRLREGRRGSEGGRERRRQ